MWVVGEWVGRWVCVCGGSVAVYVWMLRVCMQVCVGVGGRCVCVCVCGCVFGCGGVCVSGCM